MWEFFAILRALSQPLFGAKTGLRKLLDIDGADAQKCLRRWSRIR